MASASRISRPTDTPAKRSVWAASCQKRGSSSSRIQLAPWLGIGSNPVSTELACRLNQPYRSIGQPKTSAISSRAGRARIRFMHRLPLSAAG